MELGIDGIIFAHRIRQILMMQIATLINSLLLNFTLTPEFKIHV